MFSADISNWKSQLIFTILKVPMASSILLIGQLSPGEGKSFAQATQHTRWAPYTEFPSFSRVSYMGCFLGSKQNSELFFLRVRVPGQSPKLSCSRYPLPGCSEGNPTGVGRGMETSFSNHLRNAHFYPKQQLLTNIALHHFTFPFVSLSTLLIVLPCSSSFHSLTPPKRGGSKAGFPKVSFPVAHGHKVQEFTQCGKKSMSIDSGFISMLVNYQCSPPPLPLSSKYSKEQIKF